MSEIAESTVIRRLNDPGISFFRSSLAAIRRGENRHDELDKLVEDVQYTEEIADGVVLDGKRVFATQREMIDYLFETLEEDFIDKHRKDKGFWTWVALFYRSQLLTRGAKTGADARWIYAPENPRDSRRHYFAGNIYLYRDFKNCGEEAKEILFEGKLTSFSGMRDVITYNLEGARIPAVMEVLAWLYHNPKSPHKIKRGATDQDKPGTIRDLFHVVGQFAKTRDFYEVDDACELWDLLPPQFDKFKSKSEH